mmetsp:Transcript_105818/g.336999  ORF Transcript_105818/g.336999 Transcript_105818/m.336999 type:complete len:327 (-) Transcript_105818:68-1048(-)
MEGEVEHSRGVALKHNHRRRLPGPHRSGREAEDAHDTVCTCGGKHAVLGRVPHHADDGIRVRQAPHDAPSRRVSDAGRLVYAARGYLARALRPAALVPLGAICLTRVHLQSQQLLARVDAPDEEVTRAADRAHPGGSGAECQAVQPLVLASKHLPVALSGRDAPEFHVAVIGCSGKHVRIVRVKDHVEDGLGVAGLGHEFDGSGGDVADAHRAVLEGEHEPVGLARDGLDAADAGGANLDLSKGGPLRDVPQLQHTHTLGGGHKVAWLCTSPGHRLDALGLLVEAVDLALRACFVECEAAVPEGRQQVLLRERVPLGIRDRVLGCL